MKIVLESDKMFHIHRAQMEERRVSGSFLLSLMIILIAILTCVSYSRL